MTETANADQAAYWNEGAGETWAELQTRLDAQLQPLGRAVLEALAPRPGERILDVGCGCGQTTLELAEAVGPDGEAVGLDISRPMLEVARGRPTPSAAGRVVFREADAQVEPLQDFDAVSSRFGVMFFADPSAAFANLRRALKPGGRMAFVCWRPMAENPMFAVPLAAAVKHVPPPAPGEPGAPGPFAFADPERVRSILADAGWDEVRIEPLDMKISPGSLDDSVALTLRVGPLGRLLLDNPDQREAVIAEVREATRGFEEDGRVRFPSATWLVTARNA